MLGYSPLMHLTHRKVFLGRNCKYSFFLTSLSISFLEAPLEDNIASIQKCEYFYIKIQISIAFKEIIFTADNNTQVNTTKKQQPVISTCLSLQVK